MFVLKDPSIKFPQKYPKVERVDPSVKTKGYDKVGKFTLRDKIDFMPQKGLQEKLCACESNLIFLAGAASMGKGMALDAPVLTPDGFKPLGELSKGCIISGANGGTQKIEEVYDQGIKNMYRFTMRDGTSIETSEDHLWPVTLSIKKCPPISTFLTTKEIVGYWEERGNAYKNITNIKFPVNGAIQFADRGNVNIDPYILGLLLGDGGLTGASVVFTTKDAELIDAFRNYGCVVTYRSGCSYTISNRALISELKRLNVFGHNAYNKFIPQEYLYGSINNRRALLQGLMDTDGSCDKQGGIVEYSTSSRHLAQDFAFLARSLGYKVRVVERNPTYTYKGEKRCGALSFRIRLSADDLRGVFRLNRKIERVKTYQVGRGYDSNHYLADIEYTGQKECRCILVSNPDHLFVGEDFIVTHNTYSMMLKGLQGVDKPGFTGRFISVRLQDSKKGSSIYRDGVEVWGNFGGCEYNSSDYPTFSWPQWNSNIQLIHSNFNADNPAEWEEFKDYAKKNQASYIAIDEATEIKSFKMFAYWFSRNRDSSGMSPCMVLSFNPEHDHWTTQMLKDAGYLGDDWYLIPEMNGQTRYFYIEGDDAAHIIWGSSAEEVAERAHITISEKERAAGVTVHQIVKTFTFFTGDAADNLKLIAATGGQNIGNLHAVGKTQRSILHGAYFGPVENEELKVTRQMIHNLWVNPQDEDRNMYGTLDVSGGQLQSDGCPFVAWRGHTIIAIKWFYGDPKELVEWINDRLNEYDIPIENFAFDATGIGYYLTGFTRGMPVTANQRVVQEVDALGNPITVEQYFNLRSQLLGKMKVEFEKGEISCLLDKYESVPSGRKGERRALIDCLFDQINVFVCTTRNKRIYYRSKDEYKAKFHESPDLMDAIVLRARFDLDARPKKQPDVEIGEDAYIGIYNSYNGQNVVYI